MTEFDLTQAEADHLIGLPKQRVDNRAWPYPSGGGSVSIPLVSEDRREEFRLDLWRSGVNLAKSSHQNRARHVVPLIRLCIGGAPHRNPDGEDVPCPHVHRYREGYADKWAAPLVTGPFQNIEEHMQTLHDFMQYCNIVEQPVIQASGLP